MGDLERDKISFIKKLCSPTKLLFDFFCIDNDATICGHAVKILCFCNFNQADNEKQTSFDLL